MFEQWQALLNECRNDRANWQMFILQPVDNTAEWRDVNAITRHRIIIALQYDHRDSDEDLIKEIFLQELLAHEQNPFQGLAEALTIVAYLLAQYRRVENVWHFWRAKSANFDTHCGFDAQFLLSAGVATTWNFINHSEHTEKERLVSYLSDSFDNYSEADIESWFDGLRRQFPDRLPDDSLETLLSYAADYDELIDGRQLFQQWVSKQDLTNINNLRSIYYYGKDFQLYQHAIPAKRALINQADNDWDRVSETSDLIELYGLNGQFREALNAFREYEPLITSIEHWRNIGLIRILIDRLLDVAIECLTDLELCREIFFIVHNYIKAGGDTVPAININLVRIARRIGEVELEKYYYEIVKRQGFEYMFIGE